MKTLSFLSFTSWLFWLEAMFLEGQFKGPCIQILQATLGLDSGSVSCVAGTYQLL